MDEPDARSLRRRRRDTDNDLGAGAETRSAKPTPLYSKPPASRSTGLGDSYAHHTQIAQLWLRSRLLLPNGDLSDPLGTATLFRTQGEDRPLTLENVWLATELVGLIWRRFLGLFWGEGIRGRVGVYVLGRGVAGILPTARLWASSQMLDLVQKSFGSEQVTPLEVFRVAATSMLFTASDDILRFLSQNNDGIVRAHINYLLERAYLRSQLSLSIPALSSPFVSSIMYEAGVFAGFESRTTRWGNQSSSGPFEALSSTFQLVTISVQLFSQLILLLRTITSGSSELLDKSSAVLIALSLAPTLLRLFGGWSGRGRKSEGRKNWGRMNRDIRAIKDLGRNGGYKQEVVLFGLRDWVLEKWDELKTDQMRAQQDQRRGMVAFELGLGLGQEAIQTAFYVLLALRTLATNLSLGSIQLYQQTASSVIGSVRSLTSVLGEVFQSIFYLSAFLEAIDLPEHPELLLPPERQGLDLIPYESTRQPGGMAIEAIDLSFTYPGSDKPTLRSINIRISPGETLAIVGFNGGGKTTLVKALMGLYDHTGQLLINGRPSEEYDPDTLHTRTSCLFQDFSKYNLTLRENVGVGNVQQMRDIDAIERAIERGGADGVREKVGMEGQLNRFGVPDGLGDGEGAGGAGVGAGAGDGGGGGGGGKEFKQMMRDQMPFPPPGKGMRGPGRGGGGGGLLGGMGRGRGGPPPGLPPPPPGDLPPGPRPPGFGPPGAPLPEIRSILEQARLDREADKRASLSGGQWQRVALSRAFLRADESDLVVFDEPSSSLDPRAESQLFHRIHSLSRSGERRITTIYISHRFSTVRRADQIAVVEEGTIVELGSHIELMSRKGRYFELFNLQKEGFEDD